MIRPTESESEPETAGATDRDERLGEAIEAYLELAEGGTPPDPEAFAAGYPDLGEDLVAALEGLALVQGLVGEASGPGNRLEEGRRVAGYRIVRELGRGGMGIVYEAVHVGLDRPVALKVLGTQAAPDSSGRRRFLNEAKTAAGLHHTHIVPVFDVGQVGGLCYYAMQRIEGSGLDRVLRTLRRDRTVAAGSTYGSGSQKKGAALPPRTIPKPPSLDAALAASGLGDAARSWVGDVGGGTSWRRREPVDDPPTFTPPRGSAYYRWVADVGRQAAEALEHAHQRGVIHRDIKPSNLLVDAQGTIWVADFGLARRLADPSQTQFDSLLGTPRYMSPEQARIGPVDGRADVYSLGATLYELVTLRPPFDGQSAAELIEQITHREPPNPRRFDARIPLDLETILLKALAKSPGDRYATADKLADDLARFLAHEPVRARRIGPVGRLWRFARRHPSLTAVSTTAAALVLTTATVAYVKVVKERDRADDAAGEAQKAQRSTEAANLQLKAANLQLKVADRQLRAAYLAGLEKQAANVRLSNVVNRRSTGLDLLRQAAEMKPDPTLRVRLRDQALAFLSMRDVEARSSIATPDKPQHGLIFVSGGSRIASLSDDGDLGLWDVASRELVGSSRQPIAPSRLRPPNGRGGRDRPGGPRIATAGEQVAVIRPDGGVRLFNVASPETTVAELAVKGHYVTSLWASADGQRLVTVSRPVTGNQGRPFPPDRPEPPEEPRILLWDRNRLESPLATLTLPPWKSDQPFARDRSRLLLAISSDGSKIAAARSLETEVSLWDGKGRPLSPIVVQINATALALGPADLLAVAGNNGEIALWDLSPARAKHLPGVGLHQSFVSMLRFSPRDGSLLAAAGMGGGVELWDLTTHSLIAALPTREWVEDLAFSPDGRTLAAGQATSMAMWSVAEPVGQEMLPESSDIPRALAFGPDDLLAIASSDASPVPSPLRLWGEPGRCPPSLKAWDQVHPSSIGFDDQGQLIALEPDAIRWFLPSEPEPELVTKVDLPTVPFNFNRPGGPRPPDRKGSEPPPPNRITNAWIAARSPDGRTLIVNRQNNHLIWRADAPDALTRLDLPDRAIEGYPSRGPSAALDPSGTRLYHLSHRGDILIARLIREDNAREIAWRSIPLSKATALVASPDGSLLAVAESSGTIVLIDAAQGTVRERLPFPTDDAGPIESLAFAPGSRTLAVGAREQIRLWAIGHESRPVVRLPGHRGTVRALVFNPEGTRLAAADEKTVKVWDFAPLHLELGHLGLDW